MRVAFQRLSTHPFWRRLRLPLLYVFFCCAWILFSDQLLYLFFPALPDYQYYQTVKGIFFVIVTGAGLYYAIDWHFRAEQRNVDSIQQTNHSLEKLIENHPGIVYRCHNNAEFTILFISPNAREILGYAPEDLLFDNQIAFAELIYPEDRSKVTCQIKQAIAQHKPYECIYRIQKADGSIGWIYDKGERVERKGEADILEGYLMDITHIHQMEEEKQQLEQQLMHAQKMEAVGRLASGVAHDFNNILQVINGYSEFLLSQSDSQNPHYGMLQELQKAGSRGKTLVRQLLLFGRSQQSSPRTIDLNDVIENMQKMLQRLCGETIAFDYQLSPTLPLTYIDPAQVEQILMNLAVNSRDAMPQGGQIMIKTYEKVLDEDFVDDRAGAQPGRKVALQFMDDGEGIDDHTLGNIFDPFFTTKGRGEGTGLGLSTVFGIVKNAEGYIDVESALGKGTCFTIYLPAVEAVSEQSMPPAPLSHETDWRIRQVMVVEDDAAVLEVIIRILRQCELRVLAFNNPLHALDYAKNPDAAIDLLLTDLVMPSMDGGQLAQEIHKIHPGMHVLYMSGYSESERVRTLVEQTSCAFIAKPFSAESLKNKIACLLDDSRSSTANV